MGFDRIVSMGTKLAHKLGLTLPRPTEHEVLMSEEPKEPKAQGDELTRELEDAWNLYSRGGDEIPCRAIGYVLRILGQNPTEDVKAAFSVFDHNNDGSISKEELREAMVSF